VDQEGASVVTQPAEGEFKAFSGVCTHKHCFLASSEEGHIPCRCHGSTFDLRDGSVITGPAERALEEFDITVEGGKVSMA
jgi:Rieske Fe-S protein